VIHSIRSSSDIYYKEQQIVSGASFFLPGAGARKALKVLLPNTSGALASRNTEGLHKLTEC
jgi:hypothetical protein